MMLNYVKYGLSEEPDPKSAVGILKDAHDGEKLILKQRPIEVAAPPAPSTINTNVIADTQEKPAYKMQYVWWNIFLLGALHIAAVYGLCLKFEHFGANVFAKFVAFLSTLGITGGAHRLWTHRSYKANWTAQILLMFMATLTYQNSIYIWARDHRVHHKYSETDADPHNAKRGFFFCHMGWLMVRKHPDVIEKGKTIDMSDLKANPLVMFQHKYYYPLVFLIAAVLPTSIAYFVLGASWQVAVFHVTIYRYIISVNLVWCINSMAHLYGNKPYDKNIGPTESGMMRIFGFGEGFHNYHHTYPYDYKAAEFHNDSRNLTTCMIDLFAWLGWVTDRKTVSMETIDAKCARSGGGDREMDMHDPYKKVYRNIKSILIISALVYIG